MIPKAAEKYWKKHYDKVACITVYEDGFVPRSYKWPAPGTATSYIVNGLKIVEVRKCDYDRKRSYGDGPNWVIFSHKNGGLASG